MVVQDIEGVIREGNIWLVPDNAEKPIDKMKATYYNLLPLIPKLAALEINK